MEDLEAVVTTQEEWREKNRGLTVALSACLALWIVAIWLVVRL
jgi:flagellar biogenesis protein FliO